MPKIPINRSCALLLLSFVFAVKGSCQPYFNQQSKYIKANSQWVTLSGNKIDFNTVPSTVTPVTVAGFATTQGAEGVASVADPNTGQLLFYSDGGTCWNANNQVMQNGDSLLGNVIPGGSNGGTFEGSTTQGVCIVPFIGQPGKYYLFSLNGTSDWWLQTTIPSTSLYYSIIDMSLNGGLGGIVRGQKNIPVSSNAPLAEGMIAIPGDNCDIWLMTHDFKNPVFEAYHITAQGIDTTPLISTTGQQIQGGIIFNAAYQIGGMAVSPDRKMIAYCSFLGDPGTTNKGVLLCKFNAFNGIVSNALLVDTNYSCYMADFSPDGTKLYTSNSSFVGLTGNVNIQQYDVSIFDSTTIAASRVVVGTTTDISAELMCIKQYNGKVYLSGDTIKVINNPDLVGAACDLQNTNFPVSGSPNPYFPNNVVMLIDGTPTVSITASDTLVCVGKQITFLSHSTNGGPDAHFQWFLDSIAVPGATDSVFTFTPANTTSKVYLQMVSNSSCSNATVTTQTITIHTLPPPSASFTLPSSGCAGDIRVAVVDSPANITYTWSFDSAVVINGSGPGPYELSWNVPGTYTVTLQAVHDGCVANSAETTIVHSRPSLHLSATANSICSGDTTQINAATTNANSIQWLPGNSNIVINEGGSSISVSLLQGSYIDAVATNEYGCAATDSILVNAHSCCHIMIPDAFTPNGDGKNDIFRPLPNSHYKVLTLLIENRWGQPVYYSTLDIDGWDGAFGGIPQEIGVYFYTITYICVGSNDIIRESGDVTLIR